MTYNVFSGTLNPTHSLFPIENALLAGKGGWECTAWANCAVYDCLVSVCYCYTDINISPGSVATCVGVTGSLMITFLQIYY